jgi:hypothetical protein
VFNAQRLLCQHLHDEQLVSAAIAIRAKIRTCGNQMTLLTGLRVDCTGTTGTDILRRYWFFSR